MTWFFYLKRICVRRSLLKDKTKTQNARTIELLPLYRSQFSMSLRTPSPQSKIRELTRPSCSATLTSVVPDTPFTTGEAALKGSPTRRSSSASLSNDGTMPTTSSPTSSERPSGSS